METPGEDAPRLDAHEVLSEARKRSVIVDSMLCARAPREKTILELVKQVETLMDSAMRLAMIAPRAVIIEDGKTLVWRCPVDLIPKERIQDFRPKPTGKDRTP
jgi:hypothetical protein